MESRLTLPVALVFGRRPLAWPSRSRPASRPRVRGIAASFVPLLTTLLAATGCGLVSGPSAVPVASAGSGVVQEEIAGPGTVQARYAVGISSRMTGTLDRVLVDVGDEVVRGQLLAALDRTELEARVRSATSAVASARQDVELAKANLAKARADLDLARTRDRRAQALAGKGVVAAAEADDARGALQAAEANEQAARASIEAKEALLARLLEEQRVAETVLSYTALTSPMAGVITRRALEPGSAVSPGAVILQLVDADSLWVATLVDQVLAGRVTVGQQATIRLRSGAEYAGHVARVALEADPVTRELEINVAFDTKPPRFAIHEQADVTIVGRRASGIVVPAGALRRGEGGASVFVLDNGTAKRRPVRVGLAGSDRVIVTEGLTGGELVILAPAVQDGQRVTAAEKGR